MQKSETWVFYNLLYNAEKRDIGILQSAILCRKARHWYSTICYIMQKSETLVIYNLLYNAEKPDIGIQYLSLAFLHYIANCSVVVTIEQLEPYRYNDEQPTGTTFPTANKVIQSKNKRYEYTKYTIRKHNLPKYKHDNIQKSTIVPKYKYNKSTQI